MLGKLIKYDLKALAKILAPLWDQQDGCTDIK